MNLDPLPFIEHQKKLIDDNRSFGFWSREWVRGFLCGAGVVLVLWGFLG